MDYITLALVGLLLLFVGFAAGSRYRKCRLEGKTRIQSLKGIVIQGGGGPPPVR
jgi:hypothetical protein